MSQTIFANPETIKEITAWYVNAQGREGKKTFKNVVDYHLWEADVTAKGFDIDCVDTSNV